MKRCVPMLLLAALLVVASACSGRHTRPVKFGAEPIRATSAEAQRQFDEGVQALEQDRWSDASERFHLVQSQFPNDPIAVLAELYAARTGLRHIFVLAPGTSEVDPSALVALSQLAQSKVDDRIRYGAAVYYAAGLTTMGQSSEAILSLADYPSSELSPVVLARDRSPLQLLVAEAQSGAGRFDAAFVSYRGLWHLAERDELRAFATSRGFEVSARLSDEQLAERAGDDDEFLRGVAGWTLLARRVPRASESEGRALQDLLRRVAPDLVSIGEGSRVEAISVALAGRGPAQRLAIGVALPLTGRASSAGREALDGALVAADAFGSARPSTTLVLIDSATTDPAEGVAKLRAAGVAAIVGPVDNKRAALWAAAANDAEIPLFALTTEPLGSSAGAWAFRWFIDARSEASAVAQIAVREQGDLRIAVLHPNIGYGRRSAQWFTDAVARAGGAVVLDVEYDRASTDYSRLGARVAKLAPDAVFIPDTAQKVGEITAFLAQANVWGIDGIRRPDPGQRRVQVHYLGTSLWNDAALLRQARSYVVGALIPAWSSAVFGGAANDAFFGDYTTTVGRAPRDLAAFAADGVGFVRSSFAAGGTDALSVRDAATAKTAYRGLTGPTRFGGGGEAIRVLRFVSVADGKFVPTERAVTVGLPDES